MLDRNTKVVSLFILLYMAIMSATVFWIIPMLRSVLKLEGGVTFLLCMAAAIIDTPVIMRIMSYFLNK